MLVAIIILSIIIVLLIAGIILAVIFKDEDTFKQWFDAN